LADIRGGNANGEMMSWCKWPVPIFNHAI